MQTNCAFTGLYFFVLTAGFCYCYSNMKTNNVAGTDVLESAVLEVNFYCTPSGA